MSNALWIGTTGLNASQRQMDIIGNNLANSSTLGYKSADTQFANMLSQSLTSGSGSFQVGQGVAISSVNTKFDQGSFESTGSVTDMAIDGEGFFPVKDKEGAIYYTRAGAFVIDKDGYLVDVNGYRVQGINLFSAPGDAELTDICLKNIQSAPSATKTFGIGVNLNDSEDAGTSFVVSQNVFDSKGAIHNLSLTFTKTEGDGYWGCQAKLDNVETINSSCCGIKFDESGNLKNTYLTSCSAGAVSGGGAITSTTVNKPGQLYLNGTIACTRGADADTWTISSSEYPNLEFSLGDLGNDDEIAIDLDGKGGTDITLALGAGFADLSSFDLTISQVESNAADVTFEFPGLANGADIGSGNALTWNLIGDDALQVTGYAATSVIKALEVDGYTSGVLKSLSVEKDGIISGIFTNGQTSDLGQVVLANFPNVGALRKIGSYFAETNFSGAAIINSPGTGGLGEIMSNSLEQSNTDVSMEFVNMINAQRAYQASARIITTSDEMLTELMNIKR
ncbi:flagellar hook protein FlgE [Syntrophus aciditrophicus]|nr:flagellar hook protein FlgE [Syntrophus aciditrophicus]